MNVDVLGIILGAILVIIVAVMWRYHVDPDRKFDLTDLLMENGKISKLAVAFLVTLLVTSWMMIHLTINNRMTEGYMGLYGALWITPIIARLFRAPPSAEPVAPAGAPALPAGAPHV